MSAIPVRKTRPVKPPSSWPEEGQRLYWAFYNYVDQSRTGARIYLGALAPFFRYQEQQGLGFRELPKSLITSFVEQSSVYTRPSVMSTIRLWLRFLYRHKQLLLPLHNEIPPYPTIRRKRPLLSHQQVLQVLQLPPLDEPLGFRDRTFLEVAYASGMRRSELGMLTLADVDMSAWRLHVGQAKNNYQRTAPMTRQAREFLWLYLREIRPQLTSPLSPNFLWLNRYGRKMDNNSVIVRLRTVYRIKETLGFTVSLHQFRHACATHLLNGGAPLRAVMELLGHRSLENTKIYTHVTAQRLREVHEHCHPRNNGTLPESFSS